MRSFAVLAGFFAVAAIANPIVARNEETDPCDDDAPPCMTYDQASKVANNFRELIVSYSNASAIEYLTPNFMDYSDSVNELINNGCVNGPQTLGQATFPNREAFMAGQGSQPSIPFQTLNLWHTCDTVIIRWRSAMTPEISTGLIVMETTYTGNEEEPFKINTVYSEFNSGAWMYNLKIVTPTCPAPPPPSS